MILLILCICLGIGCGILYYKAQKNVAVNEAVIEQNNQIVRENERLKQSNKELKDKSASLTLESKTLEGTLSSLKDNIKTQSDVLQSLRATNQQMQDDASDRAEQFYKDRIDQLNKELEQKRIKTNQEIEEKQSRCNQEIEEKQNQLNREIEEKQSKLRQELAQEREQAVAARTEELNKLAERIGEEQDKLDDLKAKQLAFIEAQQRAEEIEAQKDYYRMVIEDLDVDEIKLLRNIQKQFSRKEAIDKLIWESYYKSPYDLLMSHLFSSTAKICGIYKITNLENGKAYIGQSVDMRERMRQHVKTSLSSAPSTNKLYQQMKKYGPENFTFEVLEIVERAKLNERETYWIDFYKTKEFGMNGTKGGA